ncbi:MAG TPA: sugar transferase, partial [Patescibacteria group bacterium]|nr:sugar transferase [Patescibacteria group bacterium]
RLKRVGQNGKIFHLYKFRSMIDGAHRLKADLRKFNERKDGPLFKMTNDPRITRVGKILRKTSLDEFAQLFNVLKGEMSLVGPRAHEPEEVAQYTREYRKLLTVRPGITGLPQISGRDKLEFSREAQLDIFYIERWSLKMDFIILLKTPFVVLMHPAV